MLKSLVINKFTDKNTAHDYLDVYESLFSPKKETAKNVLEIGIQHGGSIKLWKDYFSTAQIYGLEIIFQPKFDVDLDDPRITLMECDAYIPETISKLENIKFDVVIDDGPHTLNSMITFVQKYSSLLADDGVLIVEDIPDISWTQILFENTPEDLKKFIRVYDLRANKGRIDDILFVIKKE